MYNFWHGAGSGVGCFTCSCWVLVGEAGLRDSERGQGGRITGRVFCWDILETAFGQPEKGGVRGVTESKEIDEAESVAVPGFSAFPFPLGGALS